MKLFEKMKINFKKTSKKAPKEKDVMLQTYFTSLLALVLSMAMFFGTTYAWFTSEVSNEGNEIYIGTLSASLHKQIKETVQGEQGAEEKITYQDLADETKGYKLFDSTVRWEPGYTMLETIQIRNEGDLAFKYVLSFTDGTLEDTTANMADIAKHFDVWVYSHQPNKAAPNPVAYTDITATGSGWVKAGNLNDLLEGKNVLAGTMTEVRLPENSTETANEDTTDGAPAVHNYTLALHMNEEATATMMGHKIGLNVKLVAYQLSAELDGFQNSNNNYDSNIAAAANEAQLKNILSKGGEMLLLDDVTIEKAEDVLVMKNGRLDGANHTITVNIEATDPSVPVDVLTVKGGTIANLTVNGGTSGKALVADKLESDLYLNNSKFSGVASLELDLDLTEACDYGVYANGSTFASGVNYDNQIKEANFYLCNFEGALVAGANTRLENCTFKIEGLDVSKLAHNESITLINCTYNNVTIAEAVIKSVEGVITLEGSNQLMLDSSNKLVLKPTA